MIGIKVLTLDAAKVLKAVHKKDIPRATVSAFNRAGKTGITAARRNVSKGTKIPQKLLKKRFSLAKASIYRPNIAVYFRYQSVNPMDMGARQTKTGVKAKSYNFPGAFISKKSGKTGQVFKRVGKARLPIERQSIDLKKWTIKSTENTVRRVVPVAFKKRFEHEMARKIKRRGAR